MGDTSRVGHTARAGGDKGTPKVLQLQGPPPPTSSVSPHPRPPPPAACPTRVTFLSSPHAGDLDGGVGGMPSPESHRSQQSPGRGHRARGTPSPRVWGVQWGSPRTPPRYTISKTPRFFPETLPGLCNLQSGGGVTASPVPLPVPVPIPVPILIPVPVPVPTPGTVASPPSGITSLAGDSGQGLRWRPPSRARPLSPVPPRPGPYLL